MGSSGQFRCVLRDVCVLQAWSGRPGKSVNNLVPLPSVLSPRHCRTQVSRGKDQATPDAAQEGRSRGNLKEISSHHKEIFRSQM